MAWRYSKKDYEKVAAILKDVRTHNPHIDPTVQALRNATLDVVGTRFNMMFVEDNPNFDQNRFLSAAGITA